MVELATTPLRAVHNPEDYMKASGECLAILFATCWLVTYITEPTHHGQLLWVSNPIHDRVGYNNVCVGMDAAPATYFAQVIFPGCIYLMGRFAWTDAQRTHLLKDFMSPRQYYVSLASMWLYVFSYCTFALVFVISPMEGTGDMHDQPFESIADAKASNHSYVWAHTCSFLQLVGFRFIVVSSLYGKHGAAVRNGRVEAEPISTPAWIFLAVYGLLSFLGVTFTLINYTAYDATCKEDGYLCIEVLNSTAADGSLLPLIKPEPAIPWYLSAFIDFAWFTCLLLMSKFLPSNETLRVSYQLVDSEDVEGAKTVDVNPMLDTSEGESDAGGGGT